MASAKVATMVQVVRNMAAFPIFGLDLTCLCHNNDGHAKGAGWS